MPPVAVTVIRLVVGVAIFILPGFSLARRLPTGNDPVTAFLASSLFLFIGVLLLPAIGLSATATTVGCWLLFVAVLVRRFVRPGEREHRAATDAIAGSRLIWCVPVGIGLASVLIRGVVEPLSGFDTTFRWNYLARLLLHRGTFDGYPPVSASDFQLYGWCDGIPPLVPVLDFWLFAATGSVAPVLTILRVAVEALLVGWAVMRVSEELWGPGAGIISWATLATSALALWTVAIGQESGLLTLALVTEVYFLLRLGRAPRWQDAFWAGAAAAVAGITREYALAFIPFGLAVLGLNKASRRTLLVFGFTALVPVAPWYVRNWLTTGNPVYPQPVAGLFPTNPVHLELMHSIAREWSIPSPEHSELHLIWAIAATAGVVLILGAVGALRAGRKAAVTIAAIILVALLWFWSVPQTAGGWIYSTRVLAPAIALAAALCGWVAGTTVRTRGVLAMLLTLFAIDAARRSWFLPVTPLTPVLPWSFHQWAEKRQQIASVSEKDVYAILVAAAGGEGIVVNHPLYHSVVTDAGGRAIPLVSPDLEPTLSATLSFAEIIHELRTTRIRFIVVEPSDPMIREVAQHHPFWDELLRRPPTVRSRFAAIYDLRDASFEALAKDQLPSETRRPGS